MKKLYFAFLLLFSTILVIAQSTYPGNNKTGYGGTLGQGSLTITENGNNFDFVFTKGPGDLNDAVVIYLHTRSGGYSTTANFTDEGDGLRKAISGVQGTDRATLVFPNSFRADFAIAFDQGFGGVWELVENGSHNFVNSVNLTPTGTTTSATYSFSVAKSDIAVTPAHTGFTFVATYVSETGYRSNEFIGEKGPDSNPQNSSYTVTSNFSFGNPLPIGFSDVAAQLAGRSVNISWSATDEGSGGGFEIERSGNGTDFRGIGTVTPGRAASYAFRDNNPLNGNNFYRIAFVNVNGKKTYSKTVSVNTPSRTSLQAFVSGRIVKVMLDLGQKGLYKMTLINTSGQAVIVKDINYDGLLNSFELPLNGSVNPGIYSLLIRGKAGTLSTRILIP